MWFNLAGVQNRIANMCEKKDFYFEWSWQTYCSFEDIQVSGITIFINDHILCILFPHVQGFESWNPLAFKIYNLKCDWTFLLTISRMSKDEINSQESLIPTLHQNRCPLHNLCLQRTFYNKWVVPNLSPKGGLLPISYCNSPRFSKVTFINLRVSEWGFGFREEEDLQNALQSLSQSLSNTSQLCCDIAKCNLQPTMC